MPAFFITLIAIGAIALSAGGAVAQDKAKIEAGEQVYSTYCSTCHGLNLVSSGQTFDLRRLRADECPRFQNSVLNGKGQMHPWKGAVTDEEIDQLWQYIRANANEKPN